MYKAILVDNEQTIRKGVLGSIDWKSFQVSIVAEASDGQEALRLIHRLHPDILITDIKMPHIDGLKLSELTLEYFPDMKIILISGFDDFKYAQRGIQLGVSGYILKPIKKEELESVIFRVTTELDQRQPRMHSDTALKKNDLDHLVLAKFFQGIICGKRGNEESDAIQKQLFGNAGYFFAASLLQPDNYLAAIQDMSEEEQLAYLKEFFVTVETYIAGLEGAVDVAAEDYTCKIFLFDRNEAVLRSRITLMCSQLKQLLENAGMSVSIGIGNVYDSAYGLKASFAEAKEALKYRFVMGTGSTIYYDKVSGMDGRQDKITGDIAKEVMDAVKHSSKERTRELLDKAVFELMSNAQTSRARTNMFISEVYKYIIDFLESAGITMEEIFEDPIKEYSRAISSGTLRDTGNILMEQLSKVIDYLMLKKQGKFPVYIEKAKDYIAEHYMDSDINLGKIAGQIQMSASYFSYEFKKTLGKTYIEYLTEMRIDKAKELLLSTALKVSEISKMVGYENPSYFNYIFKQNTGLTPNQFRRT